MKRPLPFFLGMLTVTAVCGQNPCTLSLDSIYTDTLSSTCNRLEFKYRYSGGSPVKYKWTYGDGNSCTCIKPKNFYTSNGSFQVCGRIEDAAGCADSMCVTVQVSCSDPCELSGIGIFSVDTLSYSCREYELITITSSNAKKIRWDFGDGDTADSKYVIHSFSQNGNYRVRLIIRDSIACSDTSDLWVEVNCPEDEPCDFHILGVDTLTGSNCKTKTFRARTDKPGVSYWWQFGDQVSGAYPDSVSHTYQDTGLYIVCLYARDSVDCEDTICLDVLVRCPKPAGTFVPAAELPSVYPNPFDGILFIRSTEAGLLRIYDTGMRLLFTFSLSEGENRLDLQMLDPGTYFLQTESAVRIGFTRAARL